MRRHRVALMILTTTAFIASLGGSIAAGIAQQANGANTWTSSPLSVTRQRTILLPASPNLYVAPSTTSTTTTTAPSPPPSLSPPVSPTTSPPTTTTTQPGASAGDAYAKWTRVAVCEEGGWVGSSGSAYPNSLGIMASAWYAHGGGAEDPASQIAVGESLVASLSGTVASHQGGVVIYPGWVPDQGFCSSWP